MSLTAAQAATVANLAEDLRVGKLDWKALLAQALATFGPLIIQVVIDALTKEPAPTPGPTA